MLISVDGAVTVTVKPRWWQEAKPDAVASEELRHRNRWL